MTGYGRALEKVGRGEWIRTTDLLVPNQQVTQHQQRSSCHSSCDPALRVATTERFSDGIDSGRSYLSQSLHAETGHSIGHSPDGTLTKLTEAIPALRNILDLRTVGGGSDPGAVMDCVLRAWLNGRRPEEIQAEYPHLRLSQIYAAIALYRDRKEAVE